MSIFKTLRFLPISDGWSNRWPIEVLMKGIFGRTIIVGWRIVGCG